MSLNPLELREAGDAAQLRLDTLIDKIYLHGFGSALSPLHEVKQSAAFQSLKQEMRSTNDLVSSLAKLQCKFNARIPSISDHQLRQGHEGGHLILRGIYEGVVQIGIPKDSALLHVADSLHDVEINRQAGTFSTFGPKFQRPELLETFAKYGGRYPGAINMQLPLATSKGGMSGEMADILRNAIQQMKTDVKALQLVPKGEMLFEKLTKTASRHL